MITSLQTNTPNSTPSQDTPLFTASEVEHRTAVPATTLRQWERRYGLPNPKRTPSGYRLYSQNDIACIEFFKNRISDGIPASRAAQLYALEQSLPTGNNQVHQNIQFPRATNPNDLTKRLIDATLQGDSAKADAILAQAHSTMPVEDVLLELIQPTLVEIGERWHRGEITIAHEHQATAYLRGKLHGLLEMAGSPRSGPTVVVACAPGEWHEIGALTISIFLRRAGIRTHFLGANTPIVDLARFAREIKASAVMVSAGTSEVIENMRHQAHLLREVVGIVIYGGNGFNANPNLATELGGEYYGGNAKIALEKLISRFAS
jgi:MerR family transcriptional regulator, light-induced transcriptional regulator